MLASFVTLHARGAKLLSCEEDGVVVILSVPRVLLLLQEGPATHVLQTLRWIPQFNQTHGLKRERNTHTRGKQRRGRKDYTKNMELNLLQLWYDNILFNPVGGSVTMLYIVSTSCKLLRCTTHLYLYTHSEGSTVLTQ